MFEENVYLNSSRRLPLIALILLIVAALQTGRACSVAASSEHHHWRAGVRWSSRCKVPYIYT